MSNPTTHKNPLAQLRTLVNSGLPLDITVSTRLHISEDAPAFSADVDEIVSLNLALQEQEDTIKNLHEALTTSKTKVKDSVSTDYHDAIVKGWNNKVVALEQDVKDLRQMHEKAVDKLIKATEENKSLMLLLEDATNPVPDKQPKVVKTGTIHVHPDTGKPLADDEIPYLKCRSPLMRKPGAALQKNEVWQIRRYIQSGRQARWIANRMGIGESTVSGIRHNKAYTGVPLENPTKKHKQTKPITAHAGYGVVEQKHDK